MVCFTLITDSPANSSTKGELSMQRIPSWFLVAPRMLQWRDFYHVSGFWTAYFLDSHSSSSNSHSGDCGWTGQACEW